MNRRLVFITALILTLLVLALTRSVVLVNCFAAEKAQNVSLIRVIATPRLFDGHKLRLQGYLYYNGIDRAVGLYVSEVDARNSIFSNSVDLSVDETIAKNIINKYVILDGTFRAPTGSLSDYQNGRIEHISEMKAWSLGDLQGRQDSRPAN